MNTIAPQGTIFRFDSRCSSSAGNYKTLRASLSSSDAPTVPYLGMFLTEILAIYVLSIFTQRNLSNHRKRLARLLHPELLTWMFRFSLLVSSHSSLSTRNPNIRSFPWIMFKYSPAPMLPLPLTAGISCQTWSLRFGYPLQTIVLRGTEGWPWSRRETSTGETYRSCQAKEALEGVRIQHSPVDTILRPGGLVPSDCWRSITEFPLQ